MVNPVRLPRTFTTVAHVWCQQVFPLRVPPSTYKHTHVYTIQQRTQVDDIYKYPTAVVPSDSYRI